MGALDREVGGGGLINFPPLKRGGLIEELRYLFILVILKKKIKKLIRNQILTICTNFYTGYIPLIFVIGCYERCL